MPRSALVVSQRGRRTAWSMGRRWLATNTFVPPWLPARWRHPAAGYLLAGLVQLVLALLTHQLIASFPDYSFPGAVETLTVALIAFSWGLGPALFACLAGLVLEELLVLPTPLGHGHSGDLIEIVLFLAVGITLSLVASTTERSRRRAAEGRAHAHAQVQAMQQVQARMHEFLAIASHELRTPLAALVGFSEIAVTRFERLTAAVVSRLPDVTDQCAAVRTCLRDVSQASDRLTQLVDVLFDTTQIRNGTLALRSRIGLWFWR